MIIRHIEPTDLTYVLELMIKLAEFEGYIDDFAVTEKELHQRVFVNHDFQVLVAESENQIVGILVYYYLPFTYDLSQWINIKELYVRDNSRGKKVGFALMRRLAKIAMEKGSSRIQWLVMKQNKPAAAFYQSLGATINNKWEVFNIGDSGIHQLAMNK